MTIPQDRTLTCRDCGQEFVFTASEQEFFAQRGFTNDPSRCPECRAARKARLGDSGGRSSSYGGGGGYAPQRREMFPAVCAQCGKDTMVPFQPLGDRPVYCSECYSAQRGDSGYSRRSGSGSGSGYGRSY